jgi:hypothetical protein
VKGQLVKGQLVVVEGQMFFEGEQMIVDGLC